MGSLLSKLKSPRSVPSPTLRARHCGMCPNPGPQSLRLTSLAELESSMFSERSCLKYQSGDRAIEEATWSRSPNSTCACICTHPHVYTSIHIYAHIYVYISMPNHIYVYTPTCIYTYTHYVHTPTCIYTYPHYVHTSTNAHTIMMKHQKIR